MKQIAVYIVGIWKRMWKTPGYLAIFILTPFLLIFLSETMKKEEMQVRVAVCMEKPAEMAWIETDRFGQSGNQGQSERSALFLKRIEESLTEREGTIVFDICDSEEEVKRQVAAKKAQCGYVFPTDLMERLDEGRYTRSIRSYESPQTSLHTICDEVLFAEIFTVYEKMTFGEQTASYFLSGSREEGTEEEKGKQIAKRAEELLDKYLYNGSTFQFTYEDYRIDEETADSSSLIPVRGIMALMIYLCGLCGTLDALEDEAAGRVMRLNRKGVFQILTITVPAFVMGVTALFVFAVTGILEGIGTEIGRLICYLFFLTIYCSILKRIWKDEEKFCGVIPVFVLSAAVVCPVFMDLSVFLPVLKVIEKLYPMSYYLRM